VAGEGLVEERGWEYRRRQPEGTVLYEAVRDNLATLLADVFKTQTAKTPSASRSTAGSPGFPDARRLHT
jgi:hypothetical protein